MLPRHDLTHRTSAIARTNYDLQRMTIAGVKHAETILPGLDGCHGDTRGIVGRELFSRFYDPGTQPEGTPAKSKAARMAQAIHAELDRTDALASLQRFTQLDPVASAAALCNVADSLAGVELPDEPADDTDEGEEGAEGQPEGLDPETRAAMRAAIAAGVRDALNEEKAVAEAAVALFGPEGSNLGRRDADASAALRRALNADAALARAIDMLGRFRSALTSARTRHVGSGSGEPFSVQPKRDIRSALPVELLNFANKDTRMLAFYRHQQGQTMCYERRAREKQQRGPFTILLDASGSMEGQRWENAVACSLAALLLARAQGREVAALLFNSSTHRVRIDFSSNAATLETLNRIIMTRPQGGTRITEAFDALAPSNSDVEHPPGGDVLLISDGADPYFVADTARGTLDALGADLTYIVIGSESDSMPALRDLAAHCWVGADFFASDNHLADAIASAI